jgi:hypothetical protein
MVWIGNWTWTETRAINGLVGNHLRDLLSNADTGSAGKADGSHTSGAGSRSGRRSRSLLSVAVEQCSGDGSKGNSERFRCVILNGMAHWRHVRARTRHRICPEAETYAQPQLLPR